MGNCNPKNERMKRAYLLTLREARGRAESTVRGVEKALLRWETFNSFADFSRFTPSAAIAFKKELGSSLSLSTVLSTVNALKAFFEWLALQPGYKSKIRMTDINYLNLSDNEARTARAPANREYPSVEQVRYAVLTIPAATEIQCRDRALVAFTLLTGMRDDAMASLRLKHLDLSKGLVIQDPREVRTKFRKHIETYIVPVDEELEQIFRDWVRYLREERLFGENDPVFPRTKVGHDANNCFQPQGLEPTHWSNASQIRDIFKKTFSGADLPYFAPHTLRHTLVDYCQRHCRDPEMLKAVSQNFGHEEVMTTLACYGRVSTKRQGEIVRSLRPKSGKAEHEKIEQIRRLLDE